MDGAVYKGFVLTLCLVVFSLAACSSKEAEQPNQDEGSERGAPTRPVAEGDKPFGSSGLERPVVRSGRQVSIKRALLSSAGEEHLIHVWVGYRGAGVWPRCSLLEGEAVDEVRRDYPTESPECPRLDEEPVGGESVVGSAEPLGGSGSH